MNDPEDPGLPCPHEDRSYIVDGPEDSDQPCPHGDYRSCVVDGCRPLRRVHLAGVIVPPAPQVPCMWCGGDSPRGQCGPCASLLDAIHTAPRAGVAAIIDATRSEWDGQPRATAERGPEDCSIKTSGVETPRSRSPEWWAKHTVIRRVVTHFNEHGARVLFTMLGRELTLVAETAEQAERQLAYARGRWPEGVYEVREVRFWRGADGSPGDPVYTLIDETSGHTRVCSPPDRTICVEQRSNDFLAYDRDNRDARGCGSWAGSAIGDLVLAHAATFGLRIDCIDQSSELEDDRR